MQVCQLLIEMSNTKDFFERIVTRDEKWVYYSNDLRKRQRLKSADSLDSVTKRGLTKNKVLLCVW
jgi:hypothetical protein